MADITARRRRRDRLMLSLTGLCTLVSLAVLLFILGVIAWRGVSSLDWDFLAKLPKPVGETGGGIANAIVGSFKLVGAASLLGIPVGVLGALYLSEYSSPRLGFAIRCSADVLSGVPSIVVGLFAYALIVHPMRRFSALAGSVALAVIMIPLVLRNAEEFLKLVPDHLREAGLALGLPRWKVVLRIVLPTASRGILTGALLAVSRVAGETAPLLFTAFGSRFWDKGMLQPMASLPHAIFTYAISPYADWQRQAWAAALLLMLVVLGGNVAARVWLKPPAEAAH